MPHIHEKLDFTASVYIVNDGAVLLRKHDKYKAWLPPGGHVELDEDPTQAAVREAKEEVSLDVTLFGDTAPGIEGEGYQELLPPRFMNRHLIKGGPHTHVDCIYFGTSQNRNVVQGETEVSDEIRWFTKEELDDPKFEIRETIRRYAHAALDAVGAKI